MKLKLFIPDPNEMNRDSAPKVHWSEEDLIKPIESYISDMAWYNGYALAVETEDGLFFELKSPSKDSYLFNLRMGNISNVIVYKTPTGDRYSYDGEGIYIDPSYKKPENLSMGIYSIDADGTEKLLQQINYTNYYGRT